MPTAVAHTHHLIGPALYDAVQDAIARLAA